MRIRVIGAVLLAMWVVGVARAGEVPSAAGAYIDQPLPGSTLYYDLYLPKGFDAARSPRYPVVFLTGPAGKTDAFAKAVLKSWADERGVILLGVRAPFVALGGISLSGDQTVTTHADALGPYVAFVDHLPGAHPTVRVALDVDSAGGARSWALATQFADKFCGFVIGTQRCSTGLPTCPEGIAAVILKWDPHLWERAHPGVPFANLVQDHEYADWFAAVRPRLLINHNAMRELAVADKEPSPLQIQRALEWLIDGALLRGGGAVTDEEQAAAKRETTARLAAAMAQSDPSLQAAALDDLLGLPGFEGIDKARAALPAWRAAAIAVAQSQPSAILRFAALKQLLAHPRFAGSPDIQVVRNAMAALKKDPASAAEIDGWAELDRLLLLDRAAQERADLRLRLDAHEGLKKLITQWPGTVAANVAQQKLDGGKR